MRKSTLVCWAALSGFLLAFSGVRRARAELKFVANYLDPQGIGFFDATPAVPVGGNSGTSVGEQRRNAFEAALAVYAKALDGTIPVVVNAEFKPLPCTGGVGIMGQAAPAELAAGVSGLDAKVAYPIALANQIAKKDISPTGPDIEASFNGGVGQGDCSDFPAWYYGLDQKAGDNTDLVGVLLHELAHGLGFESFMDVETGVPTLAGGTDVFSRHLLDNLTNKRFDQMTDAERALATRSPRQVVWDGKAVTAAAARLLDKGSPVIQVTPTLPAFKGLLGEANFGPFLSAKGVIAGNLSVVTPKADCLSFSGPISGIALSHEADCSPLNLVVAAERAGAKALLVSRLRAREPASTLNVPSADVAKVSVNIPSLGLGPGDAAILERAASGGVNVVLSVDMTRELGTDAAGRVYLFAPDPPMPGSSLSHWDPLARPDLLLEPETTPGLSHDLTMELAALRDMGWNPCGNGQIDGTEQCDQGDSNSSVVPNACRPNCTSARCGDGVVDKGETCDLGKGNSDTLPNTCRTRCQSPSCGDGVIDSGEICDPGSASGTLPMAVCVSGCSAVTGSGGAALGSVAGSGGKRLVAISLGGGNSSGGQASAGAVMGGVGGHASGGSSTANYDSPNDSSGCSCRLAGGVSHQMSWGGLGALALGLVLARKRIRVIADSQP